MNHTCTYNAESYDLLDNTMVIFTSDNGPHMGNERTDVTYSTGIVGMA